MRQIVFTLAVALLMTACGSKSNQQSEVTMNPKPTPGTGGDHYVPMNERTGDTAIVYFTRDLSANGLIKAYEQVNGNIAGKVAVKLHTGEQNGPNIIPPAWVRAFLEKELPDVYALPQDATYLMWLDVSRYTDDSEALQQFIREKTGLFVMPGAEYNGNGNLFLRLNTACPRSMLEDGLNRFKTGLDLWRNRK